MPGKNAAMSMERPHPFGEQLIRLKMAADVHTDTGLAKVLGIRQGSIANAKARGSVPHKWFVQISLACGVEMDWLLKGEGPMRRTAPPQQPNTPPVSLNPGEPAAAIAQTDIKFKNVPVVGLAACGLTDWYNPSQVAVYASVPDDVGPRAFGIIAVGDSMQPQGIEQGFVAICDPDADLRPGDVVYVEQRDPSSGRTLASLKKYMKQDDGWVHFKNWLPPDANGEQKAVETKILAGIVTRMVPVTIVKRKP